MVDAPLVQHRYLPTVISNLIDECAAILDDPAIFAAFRQMPWIQHVIETRPPEWAQMYWDIAANVIPDEAASRALVVADSVGSPETIVLKNGLSCSGTSASYLFVTALMAHLFGDLTGQRIVEVGGGYGGQYAVSKTIYDLSWTIYDLPQIAELQRAYLSAIGLLDVSINPTESTDHDIFLSCCAFSELPDETREYYIHSVIANCPKGVILWSTPEGLPEWMRDMNIVDDYMKRSLYHPSIQWLQNNKTATDIFGPTAHYTWYWSD